MRFRPDRPDGAGGTLRRCACCGGEFVVGERTARLCPDCGEGRRAEEPLDALDFMQLPGNRRLAS
jgi:hypothetical protein